MPKSKLSEDSSLHSSRWVGTSGFQYPEWKGKFYPEEIPAKQMLSYYSKRFNSTEINYSFRRIPAARTIAAWDAETPAEFKFSFKAPQRITHFSKFRDCGELVRIFEKAILPMGGKLGPILFQLPESFKADAALLTNFLPELSSDLRAAFEFRHESWFVDEVFETLRTHNAALCIAETEEFKTPFIATASFGYLRLRREDYKPAELKKHSDFVKSQTQWQEAFAYFKHEEKCVGPKFAKKFASECAA